MKQSLLLTLLLSLFSISLFSKDLNLDTIVANADGKPLFVFMHKPHCGHCSHMIKFTLKDDEIAEEINRKFVYVNLFTGDEGDVLFQGFKGSRREFAKHIGYDFYPTSLFINEHSQIVNVTPGAREQDYFIDVLHYVATKQYLSMEFETYLDNLDLESDE